MNKMLYGTMNNTEAFYFLEMAYSFSLVKLRNVINWCQGIVEKEEIPPDWSLEILAMGDSADYRDVFRFLRYELSENIDHENINANFFALCLKKAEEGAIDLGFIFNKLIYDGNEYHLNEDVIRIIKPLEIYFSEDGWDKIKATEDSLSFLEIYRELLPNVEAII